MSLNHTIVRVCKANRDGSFATQSDRLKSLTAMGRQLREMGYRLEKIQNLKPHHIEKLVLRWEAEGIATRTLHNRTSHLRWLSEKIGKQDIVKSNSEYGISKRENVVPGRSEAKVEGYQKGDLNAIKDPHIRQSAELQKVFGLRREEAMKIQPHFSDRGEFLVLKGSWCKGGRERQIPIRTPEQRAALDRAKALAGPNRSLIPAQKTYVQQKNLWEKEMSRAGFSNTHGARHLYAQNRYQELTGHQPPAQGGPTRAEMTPEQRAADDQARGQIMEELGHGRDRRDVVAIYLGG